MGKHKWSEEKIKRWTADKRGMGTGASYRPWIEVKDVSSQGRSRRVWSPKTGRIHHLLSDIEHDIFLVAEWSASVQDIREQYPLDREVTQSIAHKLQIAHPAYPGTHVPTVMTVDFLLTVSTAQNASTYIAINAKADDEAEDSRSIEKLEIQRSYFEELGFDHHLVYRSNIPKAVVNNLVWIRDSGLTVGQVEERAGVYESLKDAMLNELSQLRPAVGSMSLAEYCDQFDDFHGQFRGVGLRVARMLLQARMLSTDLNVTDLPREPVTSFRPSLSVRSNVGARKA